MQRPIRHVLKRNFIHHLTHTPLGEKVLDRAYRVAAAFPETMPALHPESVGTAILNQAVIPARPHDDWPYWVDRQLDVGSPYFIPLNDALLLNATFRNHTRLSHPTVGGNWWVDPRGDVSFGVTGWSLHTVFRVGDRWILPAHLGLISQDWIADTGGIRTAFSDGSFLVVSETVVGSLPDSVSAVGHQTLKLSNTGTQPLSVSVWIGVRPFNIFGISPVHEVVYHPDNAFLVNDRLGVVFRNRPHNVVCVSAADGPVLDPLLQSQMILKSRCKTGLASGFAEFKVELAAGQTSELALAGPADLAERPIFSLREKVLAASKREALTGQIQTMQQVSVSDIVRTSPQSAAHPTVSISPPAAARLFPIACQRLIAQQALTAQHGVDLATLFHIQALNRLGATSRQLNIRESLVATLRSKDLATALLGAIGIFDDLSHPPYAPLSVPQLGRLRAFLQRISTFQVMPGTYPVLNLVLLYTVLTHAIPFTEASALPDLKARLESVKKQTYDALLDAAVRPAFPATILPILYLFFPFGVVPVQDPLADALRLDMTLASTAFRCAYSVFLSQRQDAEFEPVFSRLCEAASAMASWPETVHPKSGGGCSGDGDSLATLALFGMAGLILGGARKV